MRTIILADIHGCADQLQKMISALAPDPEMDRLILLGDLFDRGPDSWGVFQLVKELAEAFGERFVLLRGNHEDYLLTEKLSLTMRMVWDRVGRGTTVSSFREHGEKMEDAAPWLREHTEMFWQGEGFRCVHAGFKIDPPELNDTYTMLHDHDVVLENRYSGPLTITGHIALEKPAWFAGDTETVETLPAVSVEDFGKMETWRPLPEQGTICIDTGCGKGGKLTAMIIEDGKYILVST